MSKLLNKTQLAEALGVPRSFVTTMVAAGFEFSGGRTTRQWALAWLKSNPNFKSRPYAKDRATSPDDPRLEAATFGKSDER